MLMDQVRGMEEQLAQAQLKLRESEAQLAALREQTEARTAAALPGGNGGGVAIDHSMTAGAWRWSVEQRSKLEEVFKKMDANKDGQVDEGERAAASKLLNEVRMEFGLGREVALDGAVTFKEFEARLARAWEVARKEQALAGVSVLRAVAELLPGGSPDAPLAGLRDMSEEALQRFCGDAMPEAVKSLLQEKRKALAELGRRPSSTGAAKENSKFGQGTVAKFGKIHEFTKGLTGKIGLPDSRLEEAMKREHCDSRDSRDTFEPGNYNTTTTPEAEWRVVTDESEAERVSKGERRVRTLEQIKIECSEKVEEAGLRDEEIRALLLYTGPMFYKYNAVLRGFPQDVVDGLKGNKYTTTLHLIVSGVIKLSRCAPDPHRPRCGRQTLLCARAR